MPQRQNAHDTARRRATIAALSCCVWIGALSAAAGEDETDEHRAPSRFEEPIGYRLFPCTGTEHKPQSKLWYADGSFWCVIDGPDGNRIFELSGNRWVPQPAPDALLGGHDGRADVLWDGHKLIVLLYDKLPQLFEFTYEREQHRYALLRGFPVPLPIADGSETMVIDEDSKGRLWGSYAAAQKVYVTHSLRDHSHWDLPGQVLRDSLTKDDISTVIAFGHGRIGVFWSDQHRWEFGFRARSDRDALNRWGDVEVVDAGKGRSDDHVHLCADREGRIYAVTKDNKHKLSAHLRSPEGVWITAKDILDGGDATRPIIMAAEADSLLVVLYSRWHEGDEIIDYRTSRLGELRFGAAKPFIAVPGLNLNDVSGTKQPLPRGCVVAVADGGGSAWWNGWGEPPRTHRAPSAEVPEIHAHEVSRCPDGVLALAFDEGAGHDVADATEHASHGTLGGPWADDFAEPAWTPGIAGSALRFDGDRTFVEVPANPSLDVGGSMTLEAWIRRERTGVREAVLCKGTPGQRNYQIGLLRKNQIEFVWEVAGGRNHGLEGKQAIADTLWHHVACVYDQPAKQSRIYIDGKLDRAEPDSGAAIVNTASLFVGMRLSESGAPRDLFQGTIDQVRVTAAARYTSDFTPRPGFETGASRSIFLAWTPRYAGETEASAFDVLRQVASGASQPLHDSPLRGTVLFDAAPPAGALRYEVLAHTAARHGRRPLRIDLPGQLVQPGNPLGLQN